MSHPKRSKPKEERTSLHGLDFETAVRAALATGKMPKKPTKKRSKPAKRRK